MNTVPYMINKIYAKWSDALKDVVGSNISMESSSVINKLPYASCYFMGFPTMRSDLMGDECAVSPTVQIDIHANGQKALSKVYEIDEISHKAMVNMGFRRNYGPELITNQSDASIKRLTSRYTRLIGAGDIIK